MYIRMMLTNLRRPVLHGNGCVALVQALLWAACPTAHGETPTGDVIQAFAAEQFQDYLRERPRCGVMVGVSANGDRHYLAYGCFDDGEPVRKPDEHTIYEIGSVTKVFTALMLATLVVDQQVALDDPLSKVLPDDVELSTDLKSVTLEQLATHRSGVPRLPANLIVDAVTHADNPYAAYSLDRLRAMLPLTATVPLPQGRPAYSNFGMGLLGDALAMHEQTTYQELVQRRVLVPLKLNETYTTVPDEAAPRFISARTPQGEVCPHWDHQALAGAGVLRSTTADMLTFLEANLQAADSPLGPAIELTHQPRWERDGHGVALAWHFYSRKDGSRVYWHNGGTGGFVSYCAFHAPTQTAIVVLANSGDAATGKTTTDRIGGKIHERLIDTRKSE